MGEIGVVVAGPRDAHEAARAGRGRLDLAALLVGDDAVGLPRDDEHRGLDARDALEGRVAVAEQPTDRQERVVHPAHVRERRERRAQHQRRRWPLGGEAHHDPGTQGLAEVHEPIGVGPGAPRQVGPGCERVEVEPVLARGPRVAPVPAVVEQQDIEARSREPLRQRQAHRAVARVAVRDEDRDVTSLAGRRHEPAPECQPVVGVERDLLHRRGRRGERLGRQVDEPPLQRPDQGNDRGRDDCDREQPPHHLTPPRPGGGRWRPSRACAPPPSDPPRRVLPPGVVDGTGTGWRWRSPERWGHGLRSPRREEAV